MKLLPAAPCLSLLLAAPASAQPSASPAAPSPPARDAAELGPRNSISLTLSPMHLALRVVEVTGEFRLQEKVGVAATLGGGRTEDFSVYELGAQLAYYVTGDFDGGLHLGTEVQHVGVLDQRVESQAMATTLSARGLALGSFVGWKWIGSSGLSFVAQLGAQYITGRGEAMSGASSASTEQSKFAPLLNLNAGWSF